MLPQEVVSVTIYQDNVKTLSSDNQFFHQLYAADSRHPFVDNEVHRTHNLVRIDVANELAG